MRRVGRVASKCVAACALLLLAGCEGSILDPQANATVRDAPRARPDGAAQPEVPGVPGARERSTARSEETRRECMAGARGREVDFTPSHLLSRTEYNHVVRDLLGDDRAPLGIDPNTSQKGFDSDAYSSSLSPALAEHYLDVAEDVAARAMQEPGRLFSCDGVEDEVCARLFIESFGSRAFRRPIEAGEVDQLLGVYRVGREGADRNAGIELALTAILVSPQFLYHVETGGTPAADGERMVAPLTGYEVAARLSFYLWASVPDAMLIEAAARDELQTAAQVRAQAERMIADPRVHESTASFAEQWLHLEQLATISRDPRYGDLDGALRSALHDETVAFVDREIWNGGTLQDLFTTPESMINERLASHYGVGGVSGDELRPVTLDPAQRAGLLTQGSILAIHAKHNRTSPIHRGIFVREQMLCQMLPQPPAAVPALQEIAEGVGIRERLAQHRSDPSCNSCHRLIDPMGFPFEHYDPLGRWRDADDSGNAIDATGDVVETEGVDGMVDGAIELTTRLAESPDVRACMTAQWYRYAMHRLESAADDCTLVALEERFAESGYELRELLLAIVETEAFRFRVVEEVEACE